MSLTYLENRHNIHDSPWTPERIELVTLLWAEGLSASQIAAQLKGAITRSAVIGKVHRLKLPGRVPRQPTQRKPYMRRANGVPKPPPPRPTPPPPPIPEPSPPTAPHMRSLTFFKLKPHHCRYPLGELLDPPKLFCAADTHGDGVYCEFHQRIARPTDGRSAKKAAATYHYRG